MGQTRVGLAAERPTSAKRGNRFVARDTNQEWVGDGSEWIETTGGGGGATPGIEVPRIIRGYYDAAVQGPLANRNLVDENGDDIIVPDKAMFLGGGILILEDLVGPLGGISIGLDTLSASLFLDDGMDGIMYAGQSAIFDELYRNIQEGAWPVASFGEGHLRFFNQDVITAGSFVCTFLVADYVAGNPAP